MKKIVLSIMFVVLFLPAIASADSATRDMVSLKLIDKNTGKEMQMADFTGGDVNIRCYGYKWQEEENGFGFDDKKPVNYQPEEVYTIREYYKNQYSLMDWTHYIRFKTIDYCDFELNTNEGDKFIARAYHEWPVVEENCQFVASNENYDIFHIDRVCNMELPVEKVDKFDWETESDSTSAVNCPQTSCPLVDIDENTNNNDLDEISKPQTTPKPMGMWGWFRCLIIGLLGGKC